MDDQVDDQEYEVENILKARVVKKSARSKQLIWQYRVHWKGFTAAEDTWEPLESFGDSQDVLDNFWARANTGGRDVNDLSLFHADETFYAVGPPVKPGKRKSTGHIPKVKLDSSPPARPVARSASSKRKRSSSVEDEDEEPAPKRKSGRPRVKPKPSVPSASTSSTRGRRKKSPVEIVPSSSQSSPVATTTRRSSPPEVVPDSEDERDKNDIPSAHEDPLDATVVNGADLQRPKSTPQASSSKSKPGPSQSTPAHRAREAHPRVKRVDSDSLETGMATKSRVANAGAPAKKIKAGPGRNSGGMRSSLLTFTKTGAKVIKGKYPIPSSSALDAAADVEMKVDDAPPPPPPTAEELLKLAGLKEAAANELEDYEEDPAASSIARMLPSTSVPPVESTSKLWTRSTIFGPLGLASEALPSATYDSSDPPLFIHIESSLVPVRVVDIQPSGEASRFTSDKKGAAGTFFDKQKAQMIIDAVRTGGPSGRIVLVSDATEEQKGHFAKLTESLVDERLFVLPFNTEILAICSSRSALVCQRLNIPQKLLAGGAESLIVSLISVENPMAYANAVA